MTQLGQALPVDHASLILASGAYDAGRIAGVVILAAIITFFIVRRLGIIRSKR